MLSNQKSRVYSFQKARNGEIPVLMLWYDFTKKYLVKSVLGIILLSGPFLR